MATATKEKKKQAEKKISYLRPDSCIRPYGEDELEKLFSDMKSNYKSAVNPKRFGVALLSLGTHAPKLNSSRSPMRGTFLPQSFGNRKPKIAASGNAADAAYMLTLLRPILVIGHPGEASLFERLTQGDILLSPMLDAFETVFGSDARRELEDAGKEWAKPRKNQLHGENFPIFFIPGENGRDLQVSPAGRIEAFHNMDAIKSRMIKQAQEDRKEKRPASFGSWSSLSMASRSMNAIVGSADARIRFKVKPPKALGQFEAELYRYRKGGAFPVLRDDVLLPAVVEYAIEVIRLEDPKQYRGGNVLRALDNRAMFLARSAVRFIDEVLSEAGDPEEGKERAAPTIAGVLNAMPIRRELEGMEVEEGFDATVVRQCLLKPHFRQISAKIRKEDEA